MTPRTFSVWMKWHYKKCEDDSGFKAQEVPWSKGVYRQCDGLLSCNADGNKKLHPLTVEEPDPEEPHCLKGL